MLYFFYQVLSLIQTYTILNYVFQWCYSFKTKTFLQNLRIFIMFYFKKMNNQKLLANLYFQVIAIVKLLISCIQLNKFKLMLFQGAKICYVILQFSDKIKNAIIQFNNLTTCKQLEFLMQAGIDSDSAAALIIGAAASPIISRLPMEFLVESRQLIQMALSKK